LIRVLIRKLTTRPIWWWERNRRYAIRRLWSKLPPRDSLQDATQTIIVLTTPNMLDEAAWSAWSWTTHLGDRFATRIIVDGPFGNGFLSEVRRVLPGASVESSSALLQQALEGRDALSRFVKQHPLGTKLAILIHLQTRLDVLYSDSDVLVFDRPSNLNDNIRNQLPCYNIESEQSAYDVRMIEHGASLGLSPRERFNSGLMYIPQNSLDVMRAEELIANWNPNFFSWFTEQTALALLMRLAGAVPLPTDRYVVSNQRQFWWQEDVDYSRVHTRHFTGTTRHLLYAKGYTHLSKSSRK